MPRRFLVSIPVPYVGEVVILHARTADGQRVDYPAVVLAVVKGPTAEDPDPGVLDLVATACDGQCYCEGIPYGLAVGQWSRPPRRDPVKSLVTVQDGEDPPPYPDAPDWYRKMIGLGDSA